MKAIQSIYDIEELKWSKGVPIELVKIIEQDFLNIYDSVNENVYLMDFRLPQWEALILLERGDDVCLILDDPMTIEFVEKQTTSRQEYYYYRIVKRIDHDFQLYYSLKGQFDEPTEKHLAELAEWYER